MRCKLKFESSLVFLVAAGLGPVLACGPDFPNNLLSGGDAAVLAAPESSFARELMRMNLGWSRFQAMPLPLHAGDSSYAGQTLDAELADLKAALRAAQVPKEEADRILTSHQAERQKLRDFLTAVENSQYRWVWDENGRHEPDHTPPPFPKVEFIKGLPEEFADYLEGALAWHNPAVQDKTIAREAWERLLARPPAERRYKSTWAAFMLGKLWENADPDKAITCFQQVRELRRQGFADSTGLAAASLGLEARVYLHQKNYEQAIEMYLQQLATGDATATNSLRFAAAEALSKGEAALQPLAKNPRTQRLITAYLISQRLPEAAPPEPDPDDDQPDSAAPTAGETLPHPDNGVRTWLKAVEAANVRDVESAEKLALAAYRINEMGLAQRWIQRAPGSPVAQWLQAKLLLRAGKLQAAAALLARVAPSFPVEPHGTNELAPVVLKDTLFMDESGCWPDRVPIERQVLGELGVLSLARREYTQALDALLNAGFWMDAAYVAERVLALDELKAYVDAYWPPVTARQEAEEKEKFGSDEVSPALLREQIRYLLARRLTRAFRTEEARQYYPDEWTPRFDGLVRALKVGWDESLPADQRAKALFEAAIITRTNGMELLGTEVEPDWHIHLGRYQEGVTAGDRATNGNAGVLVASSDEFRRACEHNADPEKRFHYRYQAAALAWEAAKLMPNNSDDTARVLWTAGCWLKNRDPQTADLFYKALVRRNRKTALGAEADRQRWFPELGENGNVVPREKSPPTVTPAPEEPNSPPEGEMAPPQEAAAPQGAEQEFESKSSAPPDALPGPDAEQVSLVSPPTTAYEYVVRPGDSLTVIARRFAENGVTVKPADILSANPGLDRTQLQVGQRILIPVPNQ